MSAWMTSRTHRSAITQSAVVESIIPPERAAWLFDELTRINRLALHHRYNDKHPDELDLEHREVAEAPLDPNVLILNIGCLRYQCAEYDGWDDEEAMLIVEKLRRKLLDDQGYAGEEGEDRWYSDHGSKGPWGIDSWNQVVAIEQVNL